MSHHTEWETSDQPSTGEEGVVHLYNREETGAQTRENVTLGIGSRFSLVELRGEPAALVAYRGLLPAPSDVEAEVIRQDAGRPMTPEYRKKLRDRLTLGHYFSDVEVAFRRTPQGIEVLAAGLSEIAEFRRTTTLEERVGVIYGVG